MFCHICGESLILFKKKQRFVHQQYHKKEYPTCDVCDNMFYNSSLLTSEKEALSKQKEN